MSRAFSHCILPSCPPSSQEGGRGLGTGKGRAGESSQAQLPLSCCTAGGLLEAQKPPDSGLPSRSGLLWHLDILWPVQSSRASPASPGLDLPFCFPGSGGAPVGCFYFHPKKAIQEPGSSSPRVARQVPSSVTQQQSCPLARGEGKNE